MAEATNPIATASNPRVGSLVSPVQEVECVSYETGFKQPAAPLWRVQIGPQKRCFDFDDRHEAELLRTTVLELIASAPSPEAGAGGVLGGLSREQIARAVDPEAWAEWDAVMSLRANRWEMYSDEDKAYYADAIAFVGGPGRKPSLQAADRILSSRSGKLVASTGSGEETKGACLAAPGSCPSGDAPDGSSSQATAIPSRNDAGWKIRVYRLLKEHLHLIHNGPNAYISGYDEAIEALISLISLSDAHLTSALEQLADAIDVSDHGYSITLTSLTEAGSVYTLDLCDGSGPVKFADRDDAREHAERHRSLARAKAALAFLSARNGEAQ